MFVITSSRYLAGVLTTDAFLTSLNHFESTYDTLILNHFGNCTNFVGAKRELTERLKNFNQSEITAQLCRCNVKWFFNPPAAPHSGGEWERLIRSAKNAEDMIYMEKL